MNRASAIVLLLMLSCSSTVKRPYGFKEMVGSFDSETVQYYDIDTNFSSYHVRIVLQEDSTYMEIHDNYQCFDLIDLWGKWKVHGDTVDLSRMGDLDFENGKYVIKDTTFIFENYRNSKVALLIHDKNSLIWITESSRKRLRLTRE